MKFLSDVLDAFNKSSCFIRLGQYMCGFCLCSCLRHDNINQTQWLKSKTHLKWAACNQDMEIFAMTMLHIGKALILGSWILGVVHVEYVHYHSIDDLCLAISLGVEGD